MHLNAKKISFLGLLTAFTVLLVILSGIFDFNTLFLLAAASFGVGIAIRECGNRIGSGFFIASLVLSILLAPNKFYCLTFAAMGLYILIWEFSYDRLLPVKKVNKRRGLHWFIKYGFFNIMFIPMLLFLPRLVYQGNMNNNFLIITFVAGQIALLVYDMAYVFFQREIWGKVRGKFKL